MPDYRQNILTGDWVIIAGDRAKRPGAFAAPLATSDDDCPFCEGSEHETPHETFAVRTPGTLADGAGWQVRFVPNRYPAVTPLDDTGSRSPLVDGLSPEQLRASQPAAGVHEVIIESPRHLRSLVEFSAGEIEVVVRSYRDRMRSLAARDDIVCTVLFKNSGAGAGASLAHVHSQLMGLPQVPPRIADCVARCHVYREQHGRSLHDDWLAGELAAGDHVVGQEGDVIALCPWASRFPAETWLVPQTGPAHFEALDDGQITNFAALLHDILGRLETATGGAAFNFFLHNPPCTEPADTPSRWYLAILPRLANPGGFEWATGMHSNPVAPERAAEILRQRGSLV